MAITPDTKDWTWVLERACPECGFDTTAVQGPEVPRLLRETSSVWVTVLQEDPQVRTRLCEERWSTLEYGCHVRDVFRLFDRRLALMVLEADPTFPNWDQDATAVADRYGAQDPDVVAADLKQAAMTLAERIETLDAGAWARTATRSDGAVFSVETLSRYLIHDPIHHLRDVGAGGQIRA